MINKIYERRALLDGLKLIVVVERARAAGLKDAEWECVGWVTKEVL